MSLINVAMFDKIPVILSAELLENFVHDVNIYEIIHIFELRS